jgi:hypothetical protein
MDMKLVIEIDLDSMGEDTTGAAALCLHALAEKMEDDGDILTATRLEHHGNVIGSVRLEETGHETLEQMAARIGYVAKEGDKPTAIYRCFNEFCEIRYNNVCLEKKVDQSCMMCHCQLAYVMENV